MRKATLIAASAISLSACATSPYGASKDNALNRTLVGAAAGAALGGAVGAAAGGGAFEGAAAGAVLGGVVGGVSKSVLPQGRKLYRDTRGYCYYVDEQGRTVYDYNARC